MIRANIKGLSEILGYSESHTAKWLKEKTGMTFSQLLIKERVEKCAQLLTETDMQISDIIAMTGYKNEGFLRKEFVKRYGVSMLKFRKERE